MALAAHALATIACAESSAEQVLDEARSAVGAGRPLEAVAELDALLASDAALQLSADERIAIDTLRLEARVRAGDFSTAAAFLAAVDIADCAEAGFWLALARAGTGDAEGAIKLLQPLLALADFRYATEARVNHAILLDQVDGPAPAAEHFRALAEPGDDPDQVTIARLAAARVHLLEGDLPAAEARLVNAANSESRYLRGWLALHAGDPQAAIDHFAALDAAGDTAGFPERLKPGIQLGMARARLALGETDTAIENLVDLIDTTPLRPWLAEGMAQLGRDSLPLHPAVADAVDGWCEEVAEPRRRGFALLHRARDRIRAGAHATAIDDLETLLAEIPHHSSEIEARLLLVELHLREHRTEAAAQQLESVSRLAITPAQLDRVDYLAGMARFYAGDLAGAVAAFRSATRSASTADNSSAEQNVALARIHADLDSTVEEIAAESAVEVPTLASTPPAVLLLSRGLHLARQSDAAAFEVLGSFVSTFPSHRQAADAELALAELHLNQIPAKPVSAREQVESAKRRELTIDQRERLDHVAIWIEASAGADREVIALAEQFLDQWPVSKLRPSVMMKLGETHYRLRDYTRASETFSQLNADFPTSEHAPVAAFFAAKAASLSVVPSEQKRAVALWSEIIAGDEQFASYARHAKGLLHLRLGELDAAIETLEALLASPGNIEPELRFSSLCDLGQCWFTRNSNAGDDNDLTAAIAAFDLVLEDEEASLAWKSQASVRKAKCLEVSGQPEAALALYQDTLDVQDEAARIGASPEAQDWYYRAGFAAIRLLERDGEWKTAVEIATRLGGRGGPRSVEAQNLADRLRLEHFIWDE